MNIEKTIENIVAKCDNYIDPPTSYLYNQR